MFEMHINKPGSSSAHLHCWQAKHAVVAAASVVPVQQRVDQALHICSTAKQQKRDVLRLVELLLLLLLQLLLPCTHQFWSNRLGQWCWSGGH